MTPARLIFAGVSAGFLTSAAAAAPVRPLDLSDLGAPSFTTFSALEGVPEAVVNTVVADRVGFVWLASPLGVARYDGQRWTLVDDPAATGSASGLLLDSKGILWVTFLDHGIARFDGSRWNRYTRASGLPSDSFNGIVETTDAKGNQELWTESINAPWL